MNSGEPAWWQTLLDVSSPLWNLLSALLGGAIAAFATWRLEARRSNRERTAWLRDRRFEVCQQITEALAAMTRARGRIDGSKISGRRLTSEGYSLLEDGFFSTVTVLRESAALAGALGMEEVQARTEEIEARLSSQLSQREVKPDGEIGGLRKQLREAMARALDVSPGPAPDRAPPPPVQSPETR